MYDLPYSRPVRLVAGDFSGGKATVLDRATKVASISLTPLGADVVINLRNGIGGEILWSIEADASSGSAFQNFGYHPLDFTQGIIAEGDTDQLQSLCIAVVEPRSSGT